AREFATALQPAGVAAIKIAVDEVGDDANLAFHRELRPRSFAQVVRDGGYTVALLDGKAGDRKVRAVLADQRNVSPMKCGNKGQPSCLRTGGKHLLRQVRAYRMRDGVMHVQQVEPVNLRHLGHARGQRQIVGRVVEQRIVRDLDLVKEDVRLRLQPEWLRVGDEVHLMTALRKFDPQLGGHHPAAAVSGIARDPDLHSVSRLYSVSRLSRLPACRYVNRTLAWWMRFRRGCRDSGKARSFR